MSERLLAGGSVVTVGTFDGVHRGHVLLLRALRAAADRQGLPAAVVTFEPHPLKIVRPDAAPPLLTTREERVELFAQLGVDITLFLRFDQELAALPPERFVREILVARLGVLHLVTGYDHGFGRDRSGDAGLLREIGSREGFAVEVLPPFLVAGAPASSSRIRTALAAGEAGHAGELLGRAYGVRGTVIRGDGRGRGLGFPTANLRVEPADRMLPGEGIYVVQAVVEGELREGVVHLGPRPTYPGATPTFELHLIDFDADLYGHTIEVRFCRRLRGIEQFRGERDLIEAIAEDVAAARSFLASGGGVCGGAQLD